MIDSLGLIFDTVFPEQPPESEVPENLGLDSFSVKSRRLSIHFASQRKSSESP